MEQRRQPRIPFSCSARLLTETHATPLAAQVQNISTSGLFLTTDVVPTQGTPVRCRFRLGREPRELIGRVAWVQRFRGDRSYQGGGAGIEFLDLDLEAHALLEQITQHAHDGRDQPLEPLSVWFEGLGNPVKTQGHVTPEEIVLTTQLPFLRVGSDVKVGIDSVDGTRFRYARIDGLSLDFLRPHEPPSIVVRLRAPQTLRDEAGELSSALRSRGEAFTGAEDDAPPAPEPDYDSFELSASMAAAMTPPPLILAPPPAALASEIPAPSQPRAVAAEAPAAPQPATVPAKAARPDMLRRPRNLLIAAASVGLIGAAALLLAPSDAPPPASQNGTLDDVTLEVVETLPPVAAHARPQQQEPSPGVEAALAKQRDAVPSAPAADIPPPPRFTKAPFRLHADAGGTLVVVPVMGPSLPSEVLSLAPQPGVVAILPKARLPNKAGLFVVHHPVIDKVAVEDRPLGIYVRVLFGPRAGKATVVRAPGELRILVSHK